MSVVQPRGQRRDGLCLRERDVLWDDPEDDKAIGGTLWRSARSSEPGRPPKRWRACSTTQGRTWRGRRSSSSTRRPRRGSPPGRLTYSGSAGSEGVDRPGRHLYLGWMDVRADDWGVDYAIGYASKAIGGVFGAQSSRVRPSLWERGSATAKDHSSSRPQTPGAMAIEEDGSWGHP